MTTRAASLPATAYADWRDYLALMKPRVMTLVIFTAWCAMAAAPGHIHPFLGFVATLCIAVAAGAAGALNQWWEADIDAVMKRTAKRPIPAGRVAPGEALAYGLAMAVGSVGVMGLTVGWVAAFWLAASIGFYILVYTVWLKRRTPQNIVIGGAAGAFPVIVGWAAVTGDTPLAAWLLFAIVFLWTPPHFWSLALFMEADYARAGVPMLPVTHGLETTRRQVFLYSLPLAVVTVAPALLGQTSAFYGVCAALLSAVFLRCAYAVMRNTATAPAEMVPEKRLFRFSLIWLALVFAAYVADRLVFA